MDEALGFAVGLGTVGTSADVADGVLTQRLRNHDPAPRIGGGAEHLDLSSDAAIFWFEYFAYTPIAEWGGKKLRIPIEDDAILMESGVQFVHPANHRLLVIK